MSPVRQARPSQSMPLGVADGDVKVRAAYAMDRKKPAKVPMYWPRVGLAGVSTTLIVAGDLAVTNSPYMVAGSAGCAVVSAVAAGLTGRGDARREVDAAVRASVERMTGPLSRWHARRWNRGVVGTPRVIRLRYRPEATMNLAGWPAPLTRAIGDMLHATYVVDKHNKARGTMVLRRQDVTVADVAKDRSERIMHQLFGDDANLKRQPQGSGELLTVTYSNVIKAADPGWRASIEHVVDTALPGRWRAKWDILNDQVRFEVRPSLPKMLTRRPPQLDPASKDFWRIPLGEDEDGNVVCWNLNSSQPHLLTAGKTGKGKTNLILGVGQELSVRAIEVWAGDPKRIELRSLRNLPNVAVVTTTAEDMAGMVMAAYNEMERRYRLIEQGKARKGEFPRLVIMIDEYAEFVMRINAWWASIRFTGMPTKCPIMDYFESLIRLCRAAQMNVMVGIQRPDVKFLPGEARDNFDARVSLGPLNRDGSEMMWGSQIGCTTGLARGRAMACADDGEPTEIQTYWTPDRDNDDLTDEVLALLDSFKVEETHAKKRVSIPNPDVDEKGRELWWEAVQDARVVIDDTPRVERIVADVEARAKAVAKPVSLDEDDSYSNPTLCRLDEIRDGDLFWRDDSTSWVQVRGAEPDPLEDGMWAIAWEDDSGNDSTDLLPDDTRVKIRHLT